MKMLIAVLLLTFSMQVAAVELGIGTNSEIVDTYHWRGGSGVTYHISQDFGKYVVRYSSSELLSVQRRFKYIDLGLGISDGLKACMGIRTPLRRVVVGWQHCSNFNYDENFTHDSVYISVRF